MCQFRRDGLVKLDIILILQPGNDEPINGERFVNDLVEIL